MFTSTYSLENYFCSNDSVFILSNEQLFYYHLLFCHYSSYSKLSTQNFVNYRSWYALIHGQNLTSMWKGDWNCSTSQNVQPNNRTYVNNPHDVTHDGTNTAFLKVGATKNDD